MICSFYKEHKSLGILSTPKIKIPKLKKGLKRYQTYYSVSFSPNEDFFSKKQKKVENIKTLGKKQTAVVCIQKSQTWRYPGRVSWTSPITAPPLLNYWLSIPITDSFHSNGESNWAHGQGHHRLHFLRASQSWVQLCDSVWPMTY